MIPVILQVPTALTSICSAFIIIVLHRVLGDLGFSPVPMLRVVLKDFKIIFRYLENGDIEVPFQL